MSVNGRSWIGQKQISNKQTKHYSTGLTKISATMVGSSEICLPVRMSRALWNDRTFTAPLDAVTVHGLPQEGHDFGGDGSATEAGMKELTAGLLAAFPTSGVPVLLWSRNWVVHIPAYNILPSNCVEFLLEFLAFELNLRLFPFAIPYSIFDVAFL